MVIYSTTFVDEETRAYTYIMNLCDKILEVESDMVSL